MILSWLIDWNFAWGFAMLGLSRFSSLRLWFVQLHIFFFLVRKSFGAPRVWRRMSLSWSCWSLRLCFFCFGLVSFVRCLWKDALRIWRLRVLLLVGLVRILWLFQFGWSLVKLGEDESFCGSEFWCSGRDLEVSRPSLASAFLSFPVSLAHRESAALALLILLQVFLQV